MSQSSDVLMRHLSQSSENENNISIQNTSQTQTPPTAEQTDDKTEESELLGPVTSSPAVTS